MVRYKIPLILDTIFLFAAIFFISFICLRFYTGITALAVLLGLALAFLGGTAFVLFSGKRLNKKLLKREDQDKLEQVFNELALMKEERVVEFFDKLFKLSDAPHIREDDHIFLTEKDCRIFFKFSFEPLSVDKILALYREYRESGRLLIFTTAKAENVDRFLPTFKNLEIVTGAEIFTLLKKYDCYPDASSIKIEKESNFKRILKIIFSRERAKRFAFFGFSMLLFSLLIPFPLYYIIMGSLLLGVSVICRLFGYKKEKLSFLV